MIIHLIRHGKTEANEKRLYCGSTDLSLSPAGEAELVKLRDEIAYPAAVIYITSGMRRTAETLQIIYGKVPDMILPEFKEFYFGDFEMKSYEELKTSLDYQKWLAEYENAGCPNGESRPAFRQRIKAGLSKMYELKAESAVIVCHGGTIAVIMDILFPGQRNFYEWQPICGHGYSIRLESDAAEIIAEIK